MQIERLIKEHHQAMIDKGFYDCPECETGHPGQIFRYGEYMDCPNCKGSNIDPNKNIGELLMLIVSELSEALDAHRNNRFCTFKNHNSLNIDNLLPPGIGKSEFNGLSVYQEYFELLIKDTFEDEIADVFLRLFDLCGYLNINPSPLIPDSFKYNLENTGEILLYLSHNIFSIKNNGDREYYISISIYYMWCAAVNNWNIPIEKHILAKMAYNKTRPHKHGKEY